MYKPCMECLMRRGHAYTADCDDKCTYASDVKWREDEINNIKAKLNGTEKLLEKAYYVIGQLVDKPNPFDSKPKESERLIEMMKNGILPPLRSEIRTK